MSVRKRLTNRRPAQDTETIAAYLKEIQRLREVIDDLDKGWRVKVADLERRLNDQGQQLEGARKQSTALFGALRELLDAVRHVRLGAAIQDAMALVADRPR